MPCNNHIVGTVYSGGKEGEEAAGRPLKLRDRRRQAGPWADQARLRTAGGWRRAGGSGRWLRAGRRRPRRAGDGGPVAAIRQGRRDGCGGPVAASHRRRRACGGGPAAVIRRGRAVNQDSSGGGGWHWRGVGLSGLGGTGAEREESRNLRNAREQKRSLKKKPQGESRRCRMA
jgi:hypothetical protein